MTSMTDTEFLAALEGCTLKPADFSHAAHIRMGYLYLSQYDFPAALAAARKAIKNFAASIDRANLYHETITVAFMTLINERMTRESGGGESAASRGWEAFADANADLFTGNPVAIFYSRERLESPLARRIFLLPDRAPHDPAAGIDTNAA